MLIKAVVVEQVETGLGRRKPKDTHLGSEEVGRYLEALVHLPHGVGGEEDLPLDQERAPFRGPRSRRPAFDDGRVLD